MRVAAALLVGLALWVVVRGHDGYDMAYALLWGDELWHGRLPELRSAFAPTPHPLSNLLGLIVAPFGRPGGADAFRLAIALAFGATGVAAFEVGRRLFDSAAAGVLAAVLILTRPALLAGALRGSIDIPALALTLFALDALLRRRFETALVLLGVAGLLRPEAWLLSFAVAAWSVWREDGRARVILLAVAAPVLWCAADLIVTGDPLFSLTGTRSLAEELGRASGASTAPLLVPELIERVIGLPLMLAGAVALLALSDQPSPRFKVTLAALLLALATFVVIGAAGLPLLARYLLPAAALLAILGAGVAATAGPRAAAAARPPAAATRQPDATVAATAPAAATPPRVAPVARGVRSPRVAAARAEAPRVVAIACLLVAVPATFTGLRDAVRDSRDRRAVQADLRTLALTQACEPLSAVTYRQVPLIGYATGRSAAGIVPTPEGAAIVIPRSARAVESLQSASDQAPLLLRPPPGYALSAQSRDWALATTCPTAAPAAPRP